jgi:hypothetical protein
MQAAELMLFKSLSCRMTILVKLKGKTEESYLL